MSKKKYDINSVDKVITCLTISNSKQYLIQFKEEKLPRLVNENEFAQSDIKLLNKKREKEDTPEKKPLKNKKKKNKKDTDGSFSFSLLNKSTKKEKNNKKSKSDLEEEEVNNKKKKNNSKNKKAKKNYNKENKKNNLKKEYNDDSSDNNENDSDNHNNNENDNENNDNNSSENDNIKDNDHVSDTNSDNRGEMKKTKLYERDGVLLEDTPIKILNVGYKNRNDKTLYCLVKWKQTDNIRILDSIIETNKIKKTYPELLIEFYENRIIFLEEK